MFKKSILLSLGFCSLFGMESFNSFVKIALKNTPYLVTNSLEIEKAEYDARIKNRYKNPSLAFDKNLQDGYGVGIKQPIRLWGVAKNNAHFNSKKRAETENLVQLKKVTFIKDLSDLFIEYKKSSLEKKLSLEALKISQKIAEVSQNRFENGTISKVEYLQSQIDLDMAKNSVDEALYIELKSYYKIMQFAGIEVELELSSEIKKVKGERNSYALEYLQSRVERKEVSIKIESKTLQWIDIYAEFEEDAQQSVTKVGIELPLSIFNNNSEELALATLALKEEKLLYESKQKALKLEYQSLDKESTTLQNLQQSNQKLLNSQMQLLQIYQESYRVANVDLMKLQNIKNQMLQTKQKAIEIAFKIEKNIVVYNYLVGEDYE